MKYAATILVRAEPTTGRSPLWELVVLCIEADDEEDARAKALELSERYVSDYKTVSGDRLRWRPEAVHAIQQLEPFPPEHGSELLSIFLRDDLARSLMEPIVE
jgi:hypothetical protein